MGIVKQEERKLEFVTIMGSSGQDENEHHTQSQVRKINKVYLVE